MFIGVKRALLSPKHSEIKVRVIIFPRDRQALFYFLYNNPSYSRILNGSRLSSIRAQMHD